MGEKKTTTTLGKPRDFDVTHVSYRDEHCTRLHERPIFCQTVTWNAAVRQRTVLHQLHSMQQSFQPQLLENLIWNETKWISVVTNSRSPDLELQRDANHN